MGSRPPGDSRWGQADMSAGIREWNLDFRAPLSFGLPTPCVDCARLTPVSGTNNAVSGGSFINGVAELETSDTDLDAARETVWSDLGVRCAYDTPRR